MELLSVQEFEDLYNEDPSYAEQYLFNAHTALSQLDPSRAWDSQMALRLIAEGLSKGKYEAITPMHGLGEDIVQRMEGQWDPVGDSLEEELKWLSSPNNVSRYRDFDALAKANALRYAQDEYGRTRSVSDQLTGNDINRLLPLWNEGRIEFDPSALGGATSFRDYDQRRQDLAQMERFFGQKYANSGGMSFLKGAMFFDPDFQKNYNDPLSDEIGQIMDETWGEFGAIQRGFNPLDDSLYARYESMPEEGSPQYEAIKNYLELNLGMDVSKIKKNRRGGKSPIDVDPVINWIKKNGETLEDGSYYLKLNQYPSDMTKYLQDVVSKYDPANVAGQAVAIADIAIMPISGIYTGAVKAGFHGLKKGFQFTLDAAGALSKESKAQLLKLVPKAQADKIEKAIEAEGKITKYMYSRSNQPSITKAARINTADLNKILEKEIGFTLDPRKFAPSQHKVNFYENLRKILKPVSDPNKKIGYSYKNPTAKDIEKIKEAYNNRGKAPITTSTVNNISTLRANEQFTSILNSGQLPDYRNFMNLPEFANISASQFNNALLRLLQKMQGKDILLPRNPLARRMESEFVDDPFVGLRINRKRATKLLHEMADSKFGSPSAKAFRMAAEDFVNQALARPISYQTLVRNARSQLGTDAKNLNSLGVHEPVSLSTAFLYNMPSYSNFIIPVTRQMNENVLPQLQGRLSKIVGQFTNGEFKNTKEFIKKYNDTLDEAIKKNPEIEGTVARVMNSNEVLSYYGKKNIKNYQNLGMDLVGEADEAGFAFKIPKNAKGELPLTLEEFVQQGGTRLAKEFGGESSTDFDKLVRMYQEQYGMTLGDAVEEARKDLMRPKGEKGGAVIRQGYADPGGMVESMFGSYLQDLIAVDKGEKPRVETPYQISKYLDEETDYMERMREGLVEPAKDYIDRVKKPVEVKLDEVLAEARHQLNPGKPVKFKWSELHRLITQSPLIRKPIASTMAMNLATPLTLEAIAKDVTSFLSGKGVEDSEIKKVYPKLQAVAQGIGTVDYKNEDDYISAIDEINKAVDTGLTNLAFNSLDLVFAGIDLSGHTDFQRKLREEYSKMDLDKPETFLGKVLAFGTEMAVPYTAVIKIVNRLRKVMAVKGINTFATSLDDLSGVARATTRVSNIAKRVGVGAATFGIGDTFIGRYSAVHDMFENDPYLFMKGKEDVEGLSGRDLALANFRNRARFGADGAMIGGLFPLVGPPAWAITKGLTKHVAAPTIGVGAKLVNVPITLIADTLAGRIPYTKKMIPGGVGELIAQGSGMGAQGVRAINSFIGKQIITRAALGGMDLMQLGSKAYTGFAEYIKPTAARQLPEFSKWRMFSVNSVDPLKQNLARIDNFLSVFRDIGKLTQDAFYLSTGSRMFVNSNMRKVEKYLDIIEKDAYKLAKGFENRYNKHNDSKAASQAYLEQVLGYLKGSVKLGDLPEQLRQQSKALKNHLNEMKTQFKDLLPEGSGLRMALDKSLSEYMRKSFATFTNPNYYPGKESVDAAIKYVSQIISKNPILVEEARMAAPGAPTAAAIKEYAQLRVADIMKIGKWEIDDPILALTKMARRDLDMEDIVIKTGEELPSVIRKLLGEENNLRASVMQTASSVVEQSATKRALDTISNLGTEGGWLFNTAEEALSRGKILNAQRIEGNPGTGLLVSDIIGKYTTPELAKQFSNVNLFDSWLKSKIYQNLIAFKAMVQGGKTLYSPATQARNFGSASLFALNQGHIGGASTVTEAFKMVADDIFGAGKNINQQELLEHIARKVRLGVIDENIVANELGAVLRDLKKGEVAGLNSLFQRVGEKKMSKLVQRLYAGGDNVWKWYGHEYLKSQLTGSIKSLDEVARYFQNTIGRKFNFTDEFTGKTKTLNEGIEEMAAYMVRETYPTYSKVPPVIQALRKFPFGNFISFPAEMLRTSVASAGLSLKHIASDNAALRSLGYRGLLGQMTTLYGVNETSRFIAGQLTGIDQRQIDTYTNYLGPSYMRNHVLIPLTSKNKQGNFKVFDMSAYNPYDFVLAPIEGVIKNLNRDKLDPAAIEEDLLGRVFDVAGPMAGFMEPFIAETIGLQPFFDVMPAGYALGGRSGVTKSGKLIYGPRDTLSEKFNKGFSHILESVAPGVITTSMKMYQAAAGEIQQGEKMDLGDQLFKLMGGSTMVVNPTKSLDYAISNIQKIRGDVFKTTHFYTDDNWENRPPAVMVEELENIQRNAFRAQYDVWKMLTESIDSGLITQDQAEQALKDRGLNKFKKKLLWYGEFTPVNISEDAMEKRAENIQKAYPDEWINPDDLYPKWQLKDVIDKWKYQRFEDYELDEEDELQKVSQAPMNVPQNMNVASGPVETPPLPDTGGTPAVPPNINMAGQINQATGLTQTEDALLSPTEKLIRQRQRNRGVV